MHFPVFWCGLESLDLPRKSVATTVRGLKIKGDCFSFLRDLFCSGKPVILLAQGLSTNLGPAYIILGTEHRCFQSLNNVATICLALVLTCIAPTGFFMFSSCESFELLRWDSETCTGFKSTKGQYRPSSADAEWLRSDHYRCCVLCFWVNETNHTQVPINNLISLFF